MGFREVRRFFDLYNELTFSGFTNRWLMCAWRTKLPLKIRVFLWQVFNDKIQSAGQLNKMNWPGKIECKLCGQTETTDHIIFQCAVAQFSWCVCRDILEWPFPPTSLNDLREIAREGSNRQIKNILFLFGCVAWSLWLIRNYLVFNNLVVFSQVCIVQFPICRNGRS